MWVDTCTAEMKGSNSTMTSYLPPISPKHSTRCCWPPLVAGRLSRWGVAKSEVLVSIQPLNFLDFSRPVFCCKMGICADCTQLGRKETTHKGPHRREKLMLKGPRRSEWTLIFSHTLPVTWSKLSIYFSFCGMLWPIAPPIDMGHRTELTLLLGPRNDLLT